VSSVDVGGEQVGVVVHDPSTLADAPTRAAVTATVGLAARRFRLRAELDTQIAAVEGSRRRLLRAEEDERRRLAGQLERGPGAELDRVERLVCDARLAAGGDDELGAALDRAGAELESVRPGLDALVRGLGGPGSEALLPALERLASGLPLETRLELHRVAVAAEVGSTLWFVCAESIANVVKHADARSVRVALDVDDGLVRLVVEDDGRGGADRSGSGLTGLADRVAALGGRLVVVSPPGAGTQVVAELPGRIEA
jgi:signal transduction histidine kinase